MTTVGGERVGSGVPEAFVQVLVTARADDEAMLRLLAGWWLEESRSRLSGPLWRRREAGDSSVEAVVGRIGVPSLGRGEWSVAHTEDRFELLRASLGEWRGDAFWRVMGDPKGFEGR
ncbi:hypothetical protein F1D05_32510 [Kribbella qitaiheensis]|uniref:Uncharacterized protein n=1 Tax=Kribbella qitaiheensis TaxID=1544730 RepID=A0A7G6X6B8_9ACTN|nr:hypothetical protein [Kribbella qitaiheensis]QNE21783.1 hypothetical protein F1D05_32510 [Kribbella qitaiheensis]